MSGSLFVYLVKVSQAWSRVGVTGWLASPAMALASALADALLIEGGRPLSGRVRAAGNKNGALPILAATLLTDEPVEIRNLPRIRDVETMLGLLERLGADVQRTGPNDVRIRAAEISYEVDVEL